MTLSEAGVSVLDCVHKTPQDAGAGYPYLAIPNIRDGRIDLTSVRRITEHDLSEWTKKHVPQEGDILVTRRGRVGDTARIPANLKCAIGQNLVLLRSNGSKLDQDFLYWYCRSPQWWSEVDRVLNVGAVFSSLNVSDIPKMRISLPPLDEQRRIAGVLGVLDDLIEVNRGLIRDLDAMVHHLGRDLLLDKTDHPVVPLSEVAEVSKGYSYKSSELVPGDGWLVNLKNVGRAGTFEARGFKPLTATVKEHQIISNGDVLVAQTDLTQDREVIARPVRVRRGTLEGRLVASLDLAIVRPRPPHTNESIFAVLDSNDFRSHALGYCNGTTVLHMGARALPDYMAPLLVPEEIEEFTARVRPLREAADALSIEIADLQVTRDELLSLLMSGRVRVREDGVAV